MEVKIIDFAKTHVALLEHLGPPEKVYETAAKFISWRKETGLSPVKTSKTFGIPYVSGHSATYLNSLCNTDRNGFSANKVFHTRGVSSSILLAG